MKQINFIVFLLITLWHSLWGVIEIEKYMNTSQGIISTEKILNLYNERIELKDSEGRRSYGYLNDYLLHGSRELAEYRLKNPDLEMQKMDRTWSKYPSEIASLEKRTSSFDKEWLRNLPKYDQVKILSKKVKNVTVIKGLHLMQSIPNVTVALDNIIKEGQVKVEFLYNSNNEGHWLGSTLYDSTGNALVHARDSTVKGLPYDKRSFKNSSFRSSLCIPKYQYNGRFTKKTAGLMFTEDGLSKIFGINTKTYEKLYSKEDRRKVSYNSFVTEILEKKFSALDVDFEGQGSFVTSYSNKKTPLFGMRFKGYLTIIRSTQCTPDAPKDKIVEQ